MEYQLSLEQLHCCCSWKLLCSAGLRLLWVWLGTAGLGQDWSQALETLPTFMRCQTFP